MRPWKQLLCTSLLIAVCVTVFKFGTLYPSAIIESYVIMPAFTKQSENFGMLFGKDLDSRYSETSMEQWRSNLTTHHKGGTFCGVTYSKEMAIFNQSRIKPLPQFKNPCWYDEKEFRCFPYFFIIGASKTGTSDLYQRIQQHPQYVTPMSKEPNWFSQKIFTDRMTLRQFLKIFYTKASQRILQGWTETANNGTVSPLITGDASTTYIFYHDFWPIMPGNLNKTEPTFTNAHYIHHFNPNARIIVSVRNPIDRLWSGFLYVSKGPKNADVFHKAVVKAVEMYKDCFSKRSDRSCVHDKKLYLRSMSIPVKDDPKWRCPLNTLGSWLHLHIRIGIYSVFLRDYFKVFPKEQIFIQRLEDRKDLDQSMRDIFSFLEMDDPSPEEMKKILTLPKANVRSKSNVKVGEMKEETRQKLYEFYRPFNEELAQMAGDEKFNYGIR